MWRPLAPTTTENIKHSTTPKQISIKMEIEKKAGVAIFISDKIDFKTKTIQETKKDIT